MAVSALLLPLLLAAAPAAEAPLPRGAWRDGFNDVRTEQVPAVVRKFVIDAQGCGHFGGEFDPSNPPERNAFINQQMKKLRCDTLPERRRRLLAKYPKNAVVAGVIARVWEDYGFEE